EGFGLAVELLQIEPDRAKERKQIGTDRFARGIGGAHARETEHVLERAVDEEFAERVEHTARNRHALAIEDRLDIAPGDAEEGVKQPPLEWTRIFHADHHPGEHLLEYPWRSEKEGRADLPHVLHGSVGALRTGDAETRDQRLRIVEIMVPDPSERQVSERLVACGE